MEVGTQALGGKEELGNGGLPVDEEEREEGKDVLEDCSRGSHHRSGRDVCCCGCGGSEGEECEDGDEAGEEPGVGEREVGYPEEVLGFESRDGQVAHVPAQAVAGEGEGDLEEHWLEGGEHANARLARDGADLGAECLDLDLVLRGNSFFVRVSKRSDDGLDFLHPCRHLLLL